MKVTTVIDFVGFCSVAVAGASNYLLSSEDFASHAVVTCASALLSAVAQSLVMYHIADVYSRESQLMGGTCGIRDKTLSQVVFPIWAGAMNFFLIGSYVATAVYQGDDNPSDVQTAMLHNVLAVVATAVLWLPANRMAKKYPLISLSESKFIADKHDLGLFNKLQAGLATFKTEKKVDSQLSDFARFQGYSIEKVGHGSHSRLVLKPT